MREAGKHQLEQFGQALETVARQASAQRRAFERRMAAASGAGVTGARLEALALAAAGQWADDIVRTLGG